MKYTARAWFWIAIGLTCSVTTVAITLLIAVSAEKAIRALEHPVADCGSYYGSQPEPRLAYPESAVWTYDNVAGSEGIGQARPHTDATVGVHAVDVATVEAWYKSWLTLQGWSQLSDAGRAPHFHAWTKGKADLVVAIRTAANGSPRVEPAPGDLIIQLSYDLPDPSSWTVCSTPTGGSWPGQ